MQNREVELILKAGLSSDCSLQLDCMKLESLVIADQNAAVNVFPGLVHTAVKSTEWNAPEVLFTQAEGVFRKRD